MNGIEVVVTPSTAAGKLYPHYEEEAGILTLESNIRREWPFGVDVDGSLVFDLDERRILANFDLHVPRDRWEKYTGQSPSVVAQPGNLEFTEETIKQKSFSLALRVRFDEDKSRMRIELGDHQADRMVALSESCIALLKKTELVGFLVNGVR